MSVELLRQFQLYTANKESYDFDEREQILEQFREELKRDINNMY